MSDLSVPIQPPSRNILRSIAAVVAGMVATIAVTIATDLGLHAAGLIPGVGESAPDSVLLLATVYRTVYGVGGSYLTTRLAPRRPMLHALILGGLGMAASIAGAVATWGRAPALGHEWYPVALTVLALPSAWAGGRWRELEVSKAA